MYNYIFIFHTLYLQLHISTLWGFFARSKWSQEQHAVRALDICLDFVSVTINADIYKNSVWRLAVKL